MSSNRHSIIKLHLSVKYFCERFEVSLRIVLLKSIVVIENGKDNAAVFVLELRLIPHFVEQTGHVTGRITEWLLFGFSSEILSGVNSLLYIVSFFLTFNTQNPPLRQAYYQDAKISKNIVHGQYNLEIIDFYCERTI